MDRHDDFSDPYYALRREEPGAADAFDEALGTLDALLAPVPYLGGRAFGLADVGYVPWVIRAREVMGVSFDMFPALGDWLDRLSQRPSVAAELAVVASYAR